MPGDRIVRQETEGILMALFIYSLFLALEAVSFSTESSRMSLFSQKELVVFL